MYPSPTDKVDMFGKGAPTPYRSVWKASPSTKTTYASNLIICNIKYFHSWIRSCVDFNRSIGVSLVPALEPYHRNPPLRKAISSSYKVYPMRRNCKVSASAPVQASRNEHVSNQSYLIKFKALRFHMAQFRPGKSYGQLRTSRYPFKSAGRNHRRLQIMPMLLLRCTKAHLPGLVKSATHNRLMSSQHNGIPSGNSFIWMNLLRW